ncbi:hypothetical protein BD408DRAFT_425009 [Parasitella parasitica]|nr:hypothetical protein BD408DRAFT_425009 [Parasitella parasitica]
MLIKCYTYMYTNKKESFRFVVFVFSLLKYLYCAGFFLLPMRLGTTVWQNYKNVHNPGARQSELGYNAITRIQSISAAHKLQ